MQNAKPVKRVVLPRKPSALIRLALDDLAKCERSKRYRVNMAFWHEPVDKENSKCAVCLAGAVMAKSLGADPRKALAPSDFQRKSLALEALDLLREGICAPAFDMLQLDGATGQGFDREITEYGTSPGLFRRDMNKLVRDLAAAGF